MTDYTPALGQVLSTGLRYMDNQQRIEANERQSREQRQHEAYQFDKRHDLESRRLTEQIKYQYKALAEDAAIKHKLADAEIIDSSGRAEMNRGMGAFHAAKAGSIAEDTRQSKDTYDSRKQEALLKKRNGIFAKTIGQLDAGYARYKVREAEAGREPLSREEFFSKDPYSREVLKTLVSNDPMKRAAIESSHKMTVGDEALKEVPGHEGKFVIPGTSTVNGQQTLATTGNEVVADNPQAMPVVEDMMTVLAQADINANAAGYRGLASTANALAISSLAGGMSVEELSKPDVAHAIIKDVPGAIEVDPPEQAAAVEQTGFRQLAGSTGGAGGFHIPTGPSTTTSIVSPPAQRAKPTGGNRAVEGLRQPDRVLRAQREAGIHAVSQFSKNPEAVLEAAQGRGVTTAEAKHNRALEAKDAQMERELTAEAIKAKRAEAREERKFNRENPHAGFRQQAEREQLERGRKNAMMERGIREALRRVNFKDKSILFDGNFESIKGGSQEDGAKKLGNGTLQMIQDYPVEVRQTIQAKLRKENPNEVVPEDQNKWTERHWLEANLLQLAVVQYDQVETGIGWFAGGHRINLGNLTDDGVEAYLTDKIANDWEK